MKKILTVFCSAVLLSGILVFADDENYDGQLLTGDFSRKSMVNSSWRNATTGAERVKFIYSDLTNAIFDGAVMNAWFGAVTFNGASFRGADLSKRTTDGTGFDAAKVINVDFTGANLSDVNFQNADVSGSNFTDAIINGANFGENIAVKNFTLEQLCSTKSYKIKDLSRVNFCKVSLDGGDFSDQNLQHARFYKGSLKNTNFTGADLRDTFAADVDYEGKRIKNTIWQTGEIKNFSMESADDNLTIRKYTPVASSGKMINAKVSESDATVSGGATLKLDTGARLDVVNKKTLTIAENGVLVIDTAASDPTQIYIESLAGLVIDGKLTVNITEDLLPNVEYRFDLISFESDSNIASLKDLKPDESLYLTIKGKTFNGYWSCVINENKFTILATQVPEPAIVAAIFGALALGLAVFRRRK